MKWMSIKDHRKMPIGIMTHSFHVRRLLPRLYTYSFPHNLHIYACLKIKFHNIIRYIFFRAIGIDELLRETHLEDMGKSNNPNLLGCRVPETKK